MSSVDMADVQTAVRGRVERLRASLAKRGLDGLLVSQPESRYYLSGYTGHDLPPRDSAGYLLVTGGKAILLTDPRTTEQAQQEAGATYEVVQYETGVRGPEMVAQTAKKLGVRKLGVEAVHLPLGIWRDVASGLDGSDVVLVDTDGVVDELRIVKDAAELAHLQQAIDVLDDCFADVSGRIEPGMTERQVARMIELYLVEHAEGTSFPSIVASGPNASIPHAVPSDRMIGAGEGIKIDIGARAAQYCSDMTRTICLGQPKDPKLVEVYDLVLAAQIAAEQQLRPGMTGKDADALARDVLEQAGYGDKFTHSLGHGIGLEVHEPPWVSKTRGETVLEPGMVFSVEPGVYLPGWGGVRIEDLVVLEPSGARVLSRSPKTLVR